jgi:cystathionine beta-lyase/cystathionine gamma-synthase
MNDEPKERRRGPRPETHRIKVGRHEVGLASFLIHGRFRTAKWDYSHHVVPPISSSSTFRLESAARGAAGFLGFTDPATHRPTRRSVFIYERLDEPTRSMLEDHLAVAEDGESAVAFSSGMAAISGAVGILIRSGDEIVAHRTLYGCTYSLFTNWVPRWNVQVRYVDMTSPDALTEAITPATRVVYFETPANPTMEVIDIARVAEIVRKVNRTRRREDRIRIVVDNTFASPYCQRPLQLGADIVVHSLTKNLCGFGTEVGGVTILGSEELESELLLFRKDFGGSLSAKTAWTILVYGLPTLEIRIRRQQETALRVARFLEEHPLIERVAYPGLESFPYHEIAQRQMRDPHGRFAPGNMIYFTLSGSPEESRLLSDALVDHLAQHAYTITLAVSLGQIRTLVEKPSTMTHSTVPAESQQTAEIHPGGIRLSIGLEDADDILADLETALDAVAGKTLAPGERR